MRLLGEHRGGEAPHPLVVDARLEGDLADAAAGPEPRLDLPGRQRATGPTREPVRRIHTAAGYADRPAPADVATGQDLPHGREDLVVELDDVAPRAVAVGCAEDQAVELRRESDEVQTSQTDPLRVAAPTVGSPGSGNLPPARIGGRWPRVIRRAGGAAPARGRPG